MQGTQTQELPQLNCSSAHPSSLASLSPKPGKASSTSSHRHKETKNVSHEMAQLAKCFLCKPDSLCSIPKIYSEKKEPAPQSCFLTSHACTYDSPLPHLIITITKIKCRNVKLSLAHSGNINTSILYNQSSLHQQKNIHFFVYTHIACCAGRSTYMNSLLPGQLRWKDDLSPPVWSQKNSMNPCLSPQTK